MTVDSLQDKQKTHNWNAAYFPMNIQANIKVIFGKLDSSQLCDDVLDASGLSCPLPLLQMKLKLKSMAKDQVLRVITSDVTSVNDFRRFCELSEHHLLLITESQEQYEFLIQKG